MSGHVPFSHLFALMVPLLFPILLGWLCRTWGWFTHEQGLAIRRFAIRVSVPFLIIRNVLGTPWNDLSLYLSSTLAFLIMTLFYTLLALAGRPWAGKRQEEKNCWTFGVWLGNYSYLGWGVLAAFLGPEGLTSGIFFSLPFWPMTLLGGLVLVAFLQKKQAQQGKEWKKEMARFGLLPLLSVGLALTLHALRWTPPAPLHEVIKSLAAPAIPLIMFTIGLDLSLRVRLRASRHVLLPVAGRLILGLIPGLLTLLVMQLLGPVPPLIRKTIFVQALMPAATTSVLFAEIVPMDREGLSRVVALGNLLSLITLPAGFWLLLHLGF